MFRLYYITEVALQVFLYRVPVGVSFATKNDISSPICELIVIVYVGHVHMCSGFMAKTLSAFSLCKFDNLNPFIPLLNSTCLFRHNECVFFLCVSAST